MRPIPPSVPALVTGASSGIGERLAERLAERGHELTLVARRADRLERLARRMRRDHKVTVHVLPADLETPQGRAEVADRLRSRSPWILVNNAGFGAHGAFVDHPVDRELGMVAVNVLALHELMLATLPGNVAAGGGGVLNVASTAAYQPIPYLATYAATKAFVLHLTEAVAEEVRGTGTRVCALCPGSTRTEFGEVAGAEEAMRRLPTMNVDAVVDASLRAFDRGDVICVPGALNQLGAVAATVVPRTAIRRFLGVAAKPPR
jgi:hypothetical protein